MGVTSITQEFVCSVPPARMFKALILDSHNLVPKLMPQAIKSVDIIHGDDGAGSIKQINFAEGTHFKYMKHKIDTLDTQNFVCKYALIEGSDKIESIAYEVKFETSLDGRCSCKMTSEYHTSGGFSIRKEKSRVARKEQWPCTRSLKCTFWKTPLPMLKESFP